MIHRLNIDMERVTQLCIKWQVRELALFGSILREDFGPESDIDVLVSFQDDADWSLWDFIAMRDELEQLFGRHVDLIEKEGLRNPIRREEILRTKELLYAA